MVRVPVRPPRRVVAEVMRVVRWYLEVAYGRWEGPGCVPFFADQARVGAFAVDLDRLGRRDPDELFRMLIQFALYQSRRDVDIMANQRSTKVREAHALTSPTRLGLLVEGGRCENLRDRDLFDTSCDVRRDFVRGTATCTHRPRTPCHVKEATLTIRRMGDMGKMPTSAWLHLGASGMTRIFDQVCNTTNSPTARAVMLVGQLAQIHRIGRKLAAMFVSALSVDELSPGFAPWSPDVDGRELLVIDANVGRSVLLMRGEGAKTYDAMAQWLEAISSRIDLSCLRSTLPSYSPRLVQQALYVFRSKSNRSASGDPCASKVCPECPSTVCPFRATSTHTREPKAGC